MAQDNNLPEGTDSVIPGAMATAGKKTARKPASKRAASRSGSRTSQGGINVMDKIRSSSDKLSEQAAGKARDLVSQGLGRTAEALANVSRLVGDTADGLDERLGEDYGDYARRAADSLDSTANKLASKDPDELIDDTRSFVRKSPAVALAGAAIVGFALARLVKSGLSMSDDDGDEGSSRRRS